MRLLVTLFILMLWTSLSAQFVDDFSDGDLTTSPAWSGHLDSFTIDTAGMLRLDAPSNTATSFISTPCPVVGDARWDARIRLEFDPSSANHALLVCISDTAVLTGPVHGYAVRIGSSDDDVDLLRLDGASRTTVIDGPDDQITASINDLHVRVERTMDGHWTLLVDTARTGAWDTVGTAVDETWRTSVAAGLVCIYTSTRSDRFAMDDIAVSGIPWEDRFAPRLLDVTALSDRQIRLHFDEEMAVSPPSAVTRLDTDRHPDTIIVAGPVIDLRFADDLPPDAMTGVLLDGLGDTSGNLMPDTVLTIHRPPLYAPGSILITEVLADDYPSRGLPFGEYVEIYNASDDTVDLTDWMFFAEDDTGRIPGLRAPPAARVLLCEPSIVDDLERFAPAMAPDPWPVLNNGGERIGLVDVRRRLIHTVTYDDAWYGEQRDDDGVLLREGGVSLEMVDVSSPCAGAANWRPSSSGLGGTPGLPNTGSVTDTDFQPPEVVVINMRDLLHAEVIFDQAVAPCTGMSPGVLTTGPSPAADVWIDPEDPERVRIDWEAPITDRSVHRLRVQGLCSCGGHPIDTARTSERFGVPVSIRPGDLVVNEVLTDPAPGGVDFVEVINRSDHMVDLKDVLLVRYHDQATDSVINRGTVTRTSFQIAPDRPVAFTPDVDRLLADHPTAPRRNLLAGDLPSLPDDDVVIGLAKRVEAPFDVVRVSSDLHHPMLPETEGVSLERIDVHGPTDDTHNWASSPPSAGSATPGAPNAQLSRDQHEIDDIVQVIPPVFTPNGDGRDDLCGILYHLPDRDYVGRVRILDRTGQPIRHLVDGDLLARHGRWTWDGTDDRGRRAAAGLYVVNVRLTHPTRRNRVVNRTVVSGWDR